MSLVDEIRSRRGDPDDPFDQEAARREYRGQRRAEEDRDRANVTAGHKAGVDEERERTKKKPADSKRRPAGRDTKKKRGSVRRRSTTRRAARQLARPVRSQVSSFTESLGLVLAVIALYQLLTSAPQVSGALNAFSRGFQWLARPDSTVLPTK